MSTVKETEYLDPHLNAIIRSMSDLIRDEIDQQIINEIFGVGKHPFTHIKSFTNSKGDKRHIIEYNNEVWDWLISEHPSFGQKNPEWTLVRDNKINISDKLYTLLVLKWNDQ